MQAEKSSREAGSLPSRVRILLVDEDEISRNSFVSCFADEYDILFASTPDAAIGILEKYNDIAVILTDLQMGETDGVALLTKAHQDWPEVVRIIITGYIDASDILDTVNKGHIYHYVLKPWDSVQLGLVLEQAVAAWKLSQDNRQLARKLQEKNNQFAVINHSLLLSESRLRHLSAALITAQEHERQRLAMELHDDLGQDLAALKMQCRVLENNLVQDQPDMSNAIHEEFDGLRELINSIIENVRRITTDLSPTPIGDLGFDRAIRMLFTRFQDYFGIGGTIITTDLQKYFLAESQHHIYRLIQEALRNAGLHSSANTVDLHMQEKNQEIKICVIDDGCGFFLNQVKQNNNDGIGLTTMRERTRLLGGDFRLKSKPGEGTEVNFIFPMGTLSGEKEKQDDGTI